MHQSRLAESAVDLVGDPVDILITAAVEAITGGLLTRPARFQARNTHAKQAQ